MSGVRIASPAFPRGSTALGHPAEGGFRYEKRLGGEALTTAFSLAVCTKNRDTRGSNLSLTVQTRDPHGPEELSADQANGITEIFDQIEELKTRATRVANS